MVNSANERAVARFPIWPSLLAFAMGAARAEPTRAKTTANLEMYIFIFYCLFLFRNFCLSG